jgi:hypothetical protein
VYKIQYTCTIKHISRIDTMRIVEPLVLLLIKTVTIYNKRIVNTTDGKYQVQIKNKLLKQQFDKKQIQYTCTIKHISRIDTMR